MYSRQEIANLSDTALQIAFDGAAGRLQNDWAHGAPGRLSDVYDVALMHAEAAIRARRLDAPPMPGQLRLLELDPYTTA